jgi:ribosomal protein S18 acetylase RimI-like enzyme
MNRIDQVWFRFRELGFWESSQRALARLGLQWFSRELLFLRLDLRSLPDNAGASATFFMPSLPEVENDRTFYDGWHTHDQAVLCLRSGRILFVERRDGKNVCFGWSTRNRVSLYWFDVHFPIARDVAYCTCLYTEPLYRGRGIGSQLWREIAFYWKQQGIRHLLVVIDPQNTASIRLHRSMGFLAYQSVRYRRYGFLRHYLARDLCGNRSKHWLSVFRSPDAVGTVFWPRENGSLS